MPKYVPLKSSIENLGYSNAEDISNWMQESILKKKEDFSKHLRDAKTTGTTRRSTYRTHISEDALTLVDNLCVIYSFEGFFPTKGGPYGTSQYRPYQELKSGEFKRYIGERADERFKYYKSQRDRNDNAIANFDKLLSALDSNDKIDITKDSLRELMHKSNCTSRPIAFNPYELSSWNKLIELRNLAEEHPNDHITHRKLAESLYKLNMIDESLLELDKTLRINTEDGIALAIKSKILLEMLSPSRKEHLKARAMADYSEHISAPITSEERWINERIDETADSLEKLRKEFIETTFCALENWPHWDNTLHSGETNYQPHTAIDTNCNIEIWRGRLFYHLIMNLRPIDLLTITNAKPRLLKAYSSLRSTYYAFPETNLEIFSEEKKHEDDFLILLTAYMALISKKMHRELLDQFIDMFKNYDFCAEKNVKILSESPISNHFWEHLGTKEYTDLYSLLELYKQQNDEHNKLKTFSRRVAAKIQSTFEQAIKLYDYDVNEGLYKFCKDKPEAVTEKQIKVEFVSALNKASNVIKSMNLMIDRKAIYKMSSPEQMHHGYGDLMLYLPLIEYNLTANQEAKNIITFFTNNPNFLESCISSEDDLLLSMFDKFWNNESSHFQAVKPETFFLKAHEVVEQRYWAEFDIE